MTVFRSRSLPALPGVNPAQRAREDVEALNDWKPAEKKKDGEDAAPSPVDNKKKMMRMQTRTHQVSNMTDMDMNESDLRTPEAKKLLIYLDHVAKQYEEKEVPDLMTEQRMSDCMRDVMRKEMKLQNDVDRQTKNWAASKQKFNELQGATIEHMPDKDMQGWSPIEKLKRRTEEGKMEEDLMAQRQAAGKKCRENVLHMENARLLWRDHKSLLDWLRKVQSEKISGALRFVRDGKYVRACVRSMLRFGSTHQEVFWRVEDHTPVPLEDWMIHTLVEYCGLELDLEKAQARLAHARKNAITEQRDSLNELTVRTPDVRMNELLNSLRPNTHQQALARFQAKEEEEGRSVNFSRQGTGNKSSISTPKMMGNRPHSVSTSNFGQSRGDMMQSRGGMGFTNAFEHEFSFGDDQWNRAPTASTFDRPGTVPGTAGTGSSGARSGSRGRNDWSKRVSDELLQAVRAREAEFNDVSNQMKEIHQAICTEFRNRIFPSFNKSPQYHRLPTPLKMVETQFTQESMEQLNFITSQAFGDEVMRSMRIAAKHDLEESRMLKMWDCGASNLSRIRRKGNYKDSIRSYGSAVQMRQSPSCPSLPKIRHGHLHGSALDSII